MTEVFTPGIYGAHCVNLDVARDVDMNFVQYNVSISINLDTAHRLPNSQHDKF